MNVNQAVILCGGLGTRLRPLTYDIPKSMIPVGNKPFLELLTMYFKRQGIKKFVFCSGHLHEHIASHFGDGRPLGVDIEHSAEKEPLGTGGAILNAEKHLEKAFFVAYGDSFLDINLSLLDTIYLEKRALGIITVYENKDNIASNNVLMEKRGKVLAYEKRNPGPEMNGVEAGVSLLDKGALNLACSKNFSLEMEIFPKLINKGRLFGLLTSQRFYDIGTPEGLELARVVLK